jgi:hypothetical protein
MNRNQQNKKNKKKRNQQNPNKSIVRRQDDTYPAVAKLFLRVMFTYQDFITTRFASAASFSAFVLRLNGLYDPDPLLLTGGIAGIIEWGGLYRQNLPEFCDLIWSVVNNNNSAVVVVFVPSLTNLSASLSSGQVIANLAENKWSRRVVLSAQGGQDRATIRVRIPFAQFVGNRTQFLSGTYSGFLGSAPSNPTTIIYGTFGCYGPNALTNGVTSCLTLKIGTKLYDVQTPLT